MSLVTARTVYPKSCAHGTSGSTSSETTVPVPLETSGGVLLTVDMVVQRRDGPRRLRSHDDDDDDGMIPENKQVATVLVARGRTAASPCK